MFVPLPTHLDDPAARVEALRERDARREGGAQRGRRPHDHGARRARRPADASGSPAACSAGSPRRGPVPINLVISNVPGPPFPLYLAGARLVVDAAARSADRRRRAQHHGAELHRPHRLGLHRVPRARAALPSARRRDPRRARRAAEARRHLRQRSHGRVRCPR